MARAPNYDRFPCLRVANSEGAAVEGWDAIAERIRGAIGRSRSATTVVAIECYCGVDEETISAELTARLRPDTLLGTRGLMRSSEQIDATVAPFLGGDDPVFGFLSGLELPDFFDGEKVEAERRRIAKRLSGLVLIVGCGATLVRAPDLLVYADMPRWEGQLRFRRSEVCNLGVDNRSEDAKLQYKRAFFVDWRVCDRWKKPLIEQWDFLLDTTNPRAPKIADGDAVRRGLAETAQRPFRVVPFFDPAPWGGQWMKEVCDLNRSEENYGWCFDCVPEENSLLLSFGGVVVELPAMDLVLNQPAPLLGDAVYGRFGTEFPIRFDFLDTIGGGNLSFQVHPLTEYIQAAFGMHYTQDESYYMLDAGSGATVYLGLRDNIDPRQMIADLESAQAGGPAFDANRYANQFAAKKHDHFLIPAGTVHCSGAESMVLEISATPYIFTFKLWDWARLGLDGKPRPIHLNHGQRNIQWERTTEWVKENLINRVESLGEGDGWREERTGLHRRQFIETRRHWFTDAVPHDTDGGVNVLNLVEGEEAVVESPDDSFDPFVVHFAETFIVPASVGPYVIRPYGLSAGARCATVKAFVR